MTLASGAENLERNPNGRWESADLRVNDLWFVPPAPISSRWESISDEPPSTVHLHIKRGLLDSVAQQMGLDASRELSLGDAMHFHDPLIAAMLAALHHAARDPADSRLYVDTLVYTLAAHLLQHYSRGNEARRTGSAARTAGAAPDSPGDRLHPGQSRRRSGDCRTGRAGRAEQLSFCARVSPRDWRDTASARYAPAARGSSETAVRDGSNDTANCARGWVRECQSFLRAVQAWRWRDAACLAVAHLVAAIDNGSEGPRLIPAVNTNTVAGPPRAIM